MTRLGDTMFPLADNQRTTGSLFRWWERRRLTFNLVVGLTGLFTLIVISLISILPPGLPSLLDWRPIVVYGVLANICYTFGWAIEATAQRLWGSKVAPLGPALFRQGIAFSVGLTLLPIVVASISWVVRVVMLILS